MKKYDTITKNYGTKPKTVEFDLLWKNYSSIKNL